MELKEVSQVLIVLKKKKVTQSDIGASLWSVDIELMCEKPADNFVLAESWRRATGREVKL